MRILTFSLLFLVGCASTQKYLDSPATTQPGSLTHGQVIQTTVDTAAPWLPAPWGTVLVGAVTLGGLLLKHYSDTKKINTLDDALSTTSDVVNDVQTTVDSLHRNLVDPNSTETAMNKGVRP